MSTRLDPSHASADEALIAEGAALAPSASPIAYSVSCWVYFASVPETGYQVIWEFGGVEDVFIRLEFNNATRKFRVRAGNGYKAIGLTTVDDLTFAVETWHLVTFVASYDPNNDTLLHILYANAENGSETATTNTAPVVAFDRFVIGRTLNETPTRPATCWVEQVAIWDSALSQSDHETMFADADGDFERLPRPPTVLDPAPDKAYWMLAGHNREGIRIANDQIGATDGELNNEATTSGQPDMQIESGAPRWSAKTPGVFYPPVAHGSISPRGPKRRAGRDNPQFFFFQKPELFEPWDENPGEHPLYDDPNCLMLGRVLYANANGLNHAPPVFQNAVYSPRAYVTNVARRVADWFEFQGFTAGRGSEANGQYEGCCFLQALGRQEDQTGHAEYGELGRDPVLNQINGTDIPLEQHPADGLSGLPSGCDADDFVCMYYEHGAARVKEWAEAFWPALRDELERRGLAAPKRMHWDHESSPKPERFVRSSEDDEGNWLFHLLVDPEADPLVENARFDTEELVDVGGIPRTLWYLWFDGGEPEPNLSVSIHHSSNTAFREWVLGWQWPIREEALHRAVFTPALVAFPLAKWSNYWDLMADNPSLVVYFNTTTYKLRTAPGTPRAHFSCPVLYPPPATSFEDFTDPAKFPKALPSLRGAYVNYAINNLEACVGSTTKRPIAATIPGVGFQRKRTDPSGDILIYTVTREDVNRLLLMCWRRGVDEFIVFVPTGIEGDTDGEGLLEGDAPSAAADIDATYAAVRDFRNYIQHALARTTIDRRIGRR